MHPTSEVGLTMDYDTLKAKHDELADNNTRKESRLNNMGGSLQPFFVLQTRLQLLINKLMPMDTPERMELEIEFQTAMAQALDHGLNMAVAQAEMGNQPKPGLVLPGKKGLVTP